MSDARALREQRADAVMHGIGLPAALMGCAVLLARMPDSPGAKAAIGFYAFGLVATFGFSAAYNLSPPGPRRALLRRFDHAAIFLMIAGTYAPVSLLGIGGVLGTVLLGLVGAGALLGAAVKLLAPGRFERTAIAAYLALGWVGAVAAVPLARSLPGWQFGALVLGGLLYSLGVIAHVSTRLPYNLAIWHGFVLLAAGCHYALVLGLLAG